MSNKNDFIDIDNIDDLDEIIYFDDLEEISFNNYSENKNNNSENKFKKPLNELNISNNEKLSFLEKILLLLFFIVFTGSLNLYSYWYIFIK